MIHELLLALSGYPGSIFTWNKRSGLQVPSSSARELGSAEWAGQRQCPGEESAGSKGGASRR